MMGDKEYEELGRITSAAADEMRAAIVGAGLEEDEEAVAHPIVERDGSWANPIAFVVVAVTKRGHDCPVWSALVPVHGFEGAPGSEGFRASVGRVPGPGSPLRARTDALMVLLEPPVSAAFARARPGRRPNFPGPEWGWG